MCAAPGWVSPLVDAAALVLCMKRQANAAEIHALLAATAERPIVEVSTRDTWWAPNPSRTPTRAATSSASYGWELQLREADPAARSGAWIGRTCVGCLTGGTHRERAAPQSA